MKKTFIPFVLTFFLNLGLKSDPPLEYTVLAYGTPYKNIPEMMIGRVKSIKEKYYRAIPDGNSYQKVNPLTRAERNTFLWSDDFEVIFDADGNLRYYNDYDIGGKLIFKRVFTKEHPALILETRYLPDGKIEESTSYEYLNNKLLQISCYEGKADSLKYKIFVKINEKKMPVENHFFYSEQDTAQRILFSYDHKNRLIRSRYFNKDGEITEREALFNDRDSTYKVFYRDKDRQITRAFLLQLDYDEKGNWIRAIVKDLFKRIVIQERTIVYY